MEYLGLHVLLGFRIVLHFFSLLCSLPFLQLKIMGGKKPKDPETLIQSNPNDSPSNVFKSLFGETTIDNSLFSLFSDANPFKRKHNELGLSIQSNENPNGVESEKVDKKKKKRKVAEVEDEKEGGEINQKKEKEGGEAKTPQKKEKRKNHNPSSHNSHGANSEGDLVKKEAKKVKGLNFDVGSDSNLVMEAEKEGNTSLGDVSNGMMNENGENEKSEQNVDMGKKDKKKKRKRDELERIYEVKKYGVAEEDEREEKGGEGNKDKGLGKKRKKEENPVEMMRESKEGFDDESKLLRTVFVGNLPLKFKKKALGKEFSKFGEIESARIRSVPIIDTKIPRKGAVLRKKINDAIDSVHAYIVFKTEQSAQASLAHNMAVVGGNHIRVDRACPPRKKLKGEDAPIYDNKRTLFIGNLPFDVKDEEIYQLFSGMNNLGSSIEAVRVIRDPHTNLGKGIAYVLFKTRDAANLVVKKRYLKLRDRELRLFHASSSAPKRSNPSPAGSGSAKKLAVGTQNGENSANKKAPLSYQGLQGSKAGRKEKSWTKVPGAIKTMKGSTMRGPGTKQRTTKRPAVAARKSKAKAQTLNESASYKQTNKKRKLESRTPDTSRPGKKIKRFR